VDALDLRILRAMCPGGVYTLRGVDPFRSRTEISRLAHGSRLTVRRRLESWTRSGFWGGVATFVNPDQLGRRMYMQAFRIPITHARDEFLRTAAVSLSAIQCFQTDTVLVPLFLRPERTAAGAGGDVPVSLPDAEVLCAPYPLSFPPSKARLRSSDWTVIRQIRAHRDLDWTAIARALGISARKLRRRVTELMARDQLFFFPMTDFSRSAGTTAILAPMLGEGGRKETVRSALASLVPDSLELENTLPMQVVLPEDFQRRLTGSMQFFVPAASMAGADQLRAALNQVPGVLDTLVTFPVRNFDFPEVMDALIRDFGRPTGAS
jgi:DNA-binding Lrp family transcriptional regulator